MSDAATRHISGQYQTKAPQINDMAQRPKSRTARVPLWQVFIFSVLRAGCVFPCPLRLQLRQTRVSYTCTPYCVANISSMSYSIILLCCIRHNINVTVKLNTPSGHSPPDTCLITNSKFIEPFAFTYSTGYSNSIRPENNLNHVPVGILSARMICKMAC